MFAVGCAITAFRLLFLSRWLSLQSHFCAVLQERTVRSNCGGTRRRLDDLLACILQARMYPAVRRFCEIVKIKWQSTALHVATYCTQLSLLFKLIAMQWCTCDIFVPFLKLYCSRHPAVTFTDTSDRQLQRVGQTFSSHFSAFQNQFLLTRNLHILHWCAGSPPFRFSLWVSDRFLTLCAIFLTISSSPHTPVNYQHAWHLQTEQQYETYDEPLPLPIAVHVNLTDCF